MFAFDKVSCCLLVDFHLVIATLWHNGSISMTFYEMKQLEFESTRDRHISSGFEVCHFMFTSTAQVHYQG